MTNDKRFKCRLAWLHRSIALVVLMGGATAALCEESMPSAAEVGHSTDALLALQRDNRAAGPALPMLGDTASLSYQRYLDSFKHKIPESMGSPVNTNGSGGSGGQHSMQSY
ncbi:DUF3613 domain-containing protein [Burkholderia sp. LA-2-3-30-S1-D2]|uniref:DUF3613 domain-containing protein n=1 Tax=Burkholderia sp. LA-2-3-30-S1-D2 TaxID=1637862 RepID=UPI000754B1C8|nr:DUF3613 domain-containing protein [Burkholderia sp. LA-2-3-30-S1-D2]AOI98187.1 hypothetical protein WS66_21335 [Burkholderia sp. LA-2-3-30-S1-D2]KVE09496.1 hypothetical protein WS66_24375 [Burkholderia sp. LA-2-3-30-S1-D2]